MSSSMQTPQLVNLPDGIRLHRVAAGCGFSVGVTMHGDLVRWGEMQFNLRGVKRIVDYAPQVNNYLRRKDVRIREVVCGLSHFLAIDTKGDVWVCGPPEILGIGNTDHLNLDQLGDPINMRDKLDQDGSLKQWIGPVKQASAGIGFTALVTETGKLYTFGKAIALGLPDIDRPNNYPTHVDAFGGEKVIHVACGSYHMVAITGMIIEHSLSS